MADPVTPEYTESPVTPTVEQDRLTHIETRLSRIERLLSKLIALWEAPPSEPDPASGAASHRDPHLGAR
jgi:hypothetical protein